KIPIVPTVPQSTDNNAPTGGDVYKFAIGQIHPHMIDTSVIAKREKNKVALRELAFVFPFNDFTHLCRCAWHLPAVDFLHQQTNESGTIYARPPGGSATVRSPHPLIDKLIQLWGSQLLGRHSKYFGITFQ